MNALTEQLERLANRGPAAEPREVVAAAVARAMDSPPPNPPRHSYVRPLVVGLAAAVIGGVGLAALNAREPQSPASGESSTPDSEAARQTSDDTLEPVALEPDVTLPDFLDVSETPPVTVAGTRPTDWYRLQPDLDVAWYSLGRPNGSMLCFRTPRGVDCQVDAFAQTDFGGGPIAVGSGANQVLVVTLDEGDELRVELSDGTSLSAPIERDEQMTAWGIARFEIPEGTSLEGMAMVFLMDSPATDSTTAASTG